MNKGLSDLRFTKDHVQTPLCFKIHPGIRMVFVMGAIFWYQVVVLFYPLYC